MGEASHVTRSSPRCLRRRPCQASLLVLEKGGLWAWKDLDLLSQTASSSSACPAAQDTVCSVTCPFFHWFSFSCLALGCSQEVLLRVLKLVKSPQQICLPHEVWTEISRRHKVAGTVPREVGGSLHLLGHHHLVSIQHLRGEKAIAWLPCEHSAACTPGSLWAFSPLHSRFLRSTWPSTLPVSRKHSALYIPSSLRALPAYTPGPRLLCASPSQEANTEILVHLESNTPEAIQRQWWDIKQNNLSSAFAHLGTKHNTFIQSF